MHVNNHEASPLSVKEFVGRYMSGWICIMYDLYQVDAVWELECGNGDLRMLENMG